MKLLPTLSVVFSILSVPSLGYGAVSYDEAGVLNLFSEDTGREFSLICSVPQKQVFLATESLSHDYNLRFHFSNRPFRQFYSFGTMQGKFWVSDAYDFRWQREVLDNIAKGSAMTVYAIFQGKQFLEYNVSLKGSSRWVADFKRDCGIK
ncbi:hypothetical protein [Vibrio fluvialis]|uniref:hypothetical protein n=1 Tax=Vibrio fluvialis TaxID=676 RepID=UPI0015588AC3|nr:hypothetical protein [Vibrio fluvialis]ELE2165396.1 hypothetical protein [Vibrio fluvialis]ELO1779515.1 hypothetical protein [Vibrio fluvialis]MBL4248135.1 hypothetical protein [Vibrio fluvialis]MBL4256740.1 hypothetical protein [Vibrio fluvialis]MBL4306448.1 hypothetical protein [Vibrio fluvialis]